MPTGINADGSPKKRPPNAGRKPKDGSSMTFKLASDVVDILKTVPNKTAHIENLVRKEHKSKANQNPKKTA